MNTTVVSTLEAVGHHRMHGRARVSVAPRDKRATTSPEYKINIAQLLGFLTRCTKHVVCVEVAFAAQVAQEMHVDANVY